MVCASASLRPCAGMGLDPQRPEASRANLASQVAYCIRALGILFLAYFFESGAGQFCCPCRGRRCRCAFVTRPWPQALADGAATVTLAGTRLPSAGLRSEFAGRCACVVSTPRCAPTVRFCSAKLPVGVGVFGGRAKSGRKDVTFWSTVQSFHAGHGFDVGLGAIAHQLAWPQAMVRW
jgi:hypothetical protein